MKERIVRVQGESGDGFQNLVALSGKCGGDIRGQPVGPMARYADLNDKAGPRRRA